MDIGAPESRGRTGVASAARRAFTLLAWIFVACLIVQFVLVGLDIFGATPEQDFHVLFAYTFGWLTPLLVLVAAIARLPRRTQAEAVVLLVLFAIETYLPTLDERGPWLAAIHPVLALGIVWLAVHLARSVPWLPAGDGTPAS